MESSNENQSFINISNNILQGNSSNNFQDLSSLNQADLLSLTSDRTNIAILQNRINIAAKLLAPTLTSLDSLSNTLDNLSTTSSGRTRMDSFNEGKSSKFFIILDYPRMASIKNITELSKNR